MEEGVDIRTAIASTGAVLEGEHFFALKKGGVSTKYINMDPTLTRPNLLRVLGSLLISPFLRSCDAIAGPAVGGIPLVYMSAVALNIAHMNRDIRTAFADKTPEGFAFVRAGFAQSMHNRKVVVVEDVTTTGSSAKSVCDCVADAGGEVIGVHFVWNRGGVTKDMMGVDRIESIVTESVETWEPHKHPHWGEWPLVSDIGHPEHFPDYPGPRIKLLS